MTEVDTSVRDFKIKDASSYDAVTKEFDLLTERMTRPLADQLIELAGLRPSERILDIGTGTGAIALRAAQPVEPKRRVVGIDLSEEMLKTARAKASRARIGEGAQFVRMDAESLGFEDGSFDVVVSLFALLHFPYPLKALKEMFRVLRPGGRLALAVGSGPALFSRVGLSRGIKRLHDLVLTREGKLLTAPDFLDTLLSQHIPAPAEPEESLLAQNHTSRAGSVTRLVRKAGFRRMHKFWRGSDVVIDTAAEFWEAQRTFSSLARKRLIGAEPQKVEATKKDFFARCQEVRGRGGKLVYPFAAFYVTAQRPN